MNNCPKCGNPLQEGATSCPICGTNVLENQAQPVAPVAEPAPAVQPESKPVEPVAPAQPAQPAPVEPAAATEAPAPAATPEAAATPAAPATEEVTTAAIAPTVERVESPTPVPGIPSSDQGSGINVEQPLVENPNLKPKKKKFNPLVIVLASVVIIGIVVGMTMMPGKKATKKNNNATNYDEVAKYEMASNGYNIRLAEGWMIREDGVNVLINNKEETVIIKLDHSTTSLENVDKSGIETVMKNNEYYKEVEVSEINMSGRNSFLVNTNINELPVQVYFINGGSNLMVGATVIYQSGDTKTKYEAEVTEMVGTLSYSVEYSARAIETMSEYTTIFNVYGNVANNITSAPKETEQEPTEPQNPVEDNQQEEENNPENTEEPETPDNSEDNTNPVE